MKRLLPLLLLLLSACDLLPALLGQNGGAQPAQVPAGPAPAGTTTTTPGAQATTTSAPSTTPAPVTNGAIQTNTIDPTRRLEYVDVYTDLHDPAGQRALVPYLMKPEEWMLIKCEMLSPTAKHYKFQRVTTADGRALPQVNTFNQSR
jgi:hypothetical protein